LAELLGVTLAYTIALVFAQARWSRQGIIAVGVGFLVLTTLGDQWIWTVEYPALSPLIARACNITGGSPPILLLILGTGLTAHWMRKQESPFWRWVGVLTAIALLAPVALLFAFLWIDGVLACNPL